MKYQTEYQRNYQKRTPKKFHEYSAEERKLTEVPIKRSSTRRRRGRSLPNRNNLEQNYAVIGPNEKFSQSQLYRMREPVKDHPRVAKSQEYAILGRNEKFGDNVAYPLRRPVISDSPRVVVRRRKHENHSCGIQTELGRATNGSFDARYKREGLANRRRRDTQSEYKDKYNWKQPVGGSFDDRRFIDNSKSRDGRSNTNVNPSEKTSVAVNTPARVEIDVNQNRQQPTRFVTSPKKPSRPPRDETTEYRRSYKPIPISKKPRIRKAFEAEQIDDRKRYEFPRTERAYSDDEYTGGNVDLGNEFRQKYPHGKLRRWKSEYQSTYKPFSRFDYKDGKWYKDSAEEDRGFNPNLFWYKELMSTRKRADEFRANAEYDHFNPDRTLQLQTGFNINRNDRAWDVDEYDDDSDSVVSIDRDLERERIEGERRRERDARWNEHERIYHEKPKPDQVTQTEHQTDRVVYIDDPPPKQPSAATKAFVRNLGSSSVQQHMSWDSESLYTQRTNSDLDTKSITARKHYGNDHSIYRNKVIYKTSSKKQESRGTGMYSPLSNERQQKSHNNGYMSPQTTHKNETNYTNVGTATNNQETNNTTGRLNYDTHTFNERPHTSANEYCSYPGSRFKDEVTEYYYADDNNRQKQQHQYTPGSKPSFQNHAHTLDDRYGRTYNINNRDDDVHSINSNRSLSSSCSLASQTLERAQENMKKYWGDHASTSPKKPSSAKH